MSNREKSYLYTALSIAELNCTQFITSTYAPIETFVIEHQSILHLDKSAIIIDIGHNGIRISGFEISSKQITQTFGLFQDNIGSQLINTNLLKLVFNRTKYNYKESDVNKYIETIRKAKESLSKLEKVNFEVNSQTVILTQSDVESCCAEIKESLSRMILPLKNNQPQLLKKVKFTLSAAVQKFHV